MSLFSLCSVFYMEVRNSWPCAGREVIYVFSIRDSLAFRLHCIQGRDDGPFGNQSLC